MILLLLIFFLTLPVHAKESKEIADTRPVLTWAFSAMDNLTNLDKKNYMTEESEIFLNYKENMPEYKHVFMYANVPRIEFELKKNKRLCYPASTNVEGRKSFTYMALQHLSALPYVVIRKEALKAMKLEHAKSISLKRLVQEPSLTGLRSAGRAFSREIDDILTSEGSNVRDKAVAPFSAGILESLVHGRGDYTIEYTKILRSLQGNPPHFEALVSLPIEDAKEVLKVYIACSKTPEGLEVIKKADKIIRENVHKPIYWQARLDSAPESDRVKFKKEIERFIERRRKSPDLIL